LSRSAADELHLGCSSSAHQNVLFGEPSLSRYVLGYNTNMVKRNEAPKCYEEMLEPIEE
jgi:hypothetical protein